MATGALVRSALIEIVPLACYILFIFYAFCDGFKMRPARKVMWAVYFLFFSHLSYWSVGRFDLELIIPLSSVVAFALAWFQRRENKRKT